MPHSQFMQGKTILVAEDFDDTRLMMRVWLRGLGFRVVEAADGKEAIEIARRERPDLIIMDLSLPVLDGLNAAQRILASEKLCRVPIIVYSAHSACEWGDKALLAGCSEFVTKPIDFDVLGVVINRHLSAVESRPVL